MNVMKDDLEEICFMSDIMQARGRSSQCYGDCYV